VVVPLSVKAVAIVTCWPPATWVFEAILFSDVLPLVLLYFQVSPTVVGNGREPEDRVTEDCEPELVADADADAVEPVPEVVAPDVAALVAAPAAAAADPVVLPHPVRTRLAAAAVTANAPAVRRTCCA
jgi:hypothetical protein